MHWAVGMQLSRRHISIEPPLPRLPIAPHPYCLGAVRVHVIDPSAYTPPYDHALCRALGRAGAEVELLTSRFAYGPVALPESYVRRELFYRAAVGAPAGRLRTLCKLVEHVPDMLRYRRLARDADVVHFQWLPVQYLDGHLLPARRSRTGRHRPLVLTAHDVLPREPRPGQLVAQRRLYDRFDAIVVHSEHGRTRLVEELGADPDRVNVIPHGVFTHLAEHAASAPALGPALDTEKAVVLCFGLMRPYKGIDVLLDAWAGRGAGVGSGERAAGGSQVGGNPIMEAELWIAGMPRMDISALQAGAPGNVRFMPRFIGDDELPAYFQRADLVVLPYLQADQSGVLFTALAFGKPLLLSDVGGFPELARTGAARVVSAGDSRALGEALRELLADRAALTEMCVKARAAARGRYSWEAIARAHLELYERLLGEAPRQ
jgi:glycosyltransferase involved in cell wall biosynthesis